MFMKILLQNDGGGIGIDALAAPLRDHRRRIAFVDQHYFDTEAAIQLIGKAPATHRHFVFGAIGMVRQADDAARRLPLVNQRLDGDKFQIVIGGADDDQRLRLS